MSAAMGVCRLKRSFRQMEPHEALPQLRTGAYRGDIPRMLALPADSLRDPAVCAWWVRDMPAEPVQEAAAMFWHVAGISPRGGTPGNACQRSACAWRSGCWTAAARTLL